jgi:hypothetical protein
MPFVLVILYMHQSILLIRHCHHHQHQHHCLPHPTVYVIGHHSWQLQLVLQ